MLYGQMWVRTALPVITRLLCRRIVGAGAIRIPSGPTKEPHRVQGVVDSMRPGRIQDGQFISRRQMKRAEGAVRCTQQVVLINDAESV